jgi:hypothetical protein
MDFLTAARALTQQLAGVSSEHEPVVRAALLMAARPWHEAIHHGANALRWGGFASDMLAVEASWWHGPAPHTVVCDPPQAGATLDQAVAALSEAIATVFAAAADETGGTVAWRYAAAAGQIRDAATLLVQQRPGAPA